jgi:hypothetical protein
MNCIQCGEVIVWDNDAEELILETGECECYDGNPHVVESQIVCSRAGASSRTADELSAQLIIDAWDIVIDSYSPSPWESATYKSVCDVTGWLDDPDDAEYLNDVRDHFERILGDRGMCVAWEDGYSIIRAFNPKLDLEVSQ